jgi:UDP-N-acetylglucosamine 2-epimerase
MKGDSPNATVLAVVGTRPEAIKLAPVVRAIDARSPRIAARVCATAQHRRLLDQALKALQLRVDIDLNVMSPNQRLGALTAAVVARMEQTLDAHRPQMVVVQGDTTTAFASALAGFYAGIPVAHVEAGLRTGDPARPFPEEMNRRMVGSLATLHFAPTERARRALLREGVDDAAIQVTGNTVIDALLTTAARLDADPALAARVAKRVEMLRPGARLVLITGHRRESFGQGFEGICAGIGRLARAYPKTDFVYPVHLNPNVRGVVGQRLGAVDNVHLLEPVDYLTFVYVLRRCHLVLTDSGGIQEEAPAFGRPVLVMRETTERAEAIEAGTARLIGTDPDRIEAEARRLLDDDEAHRAMARAHNPFGDGHASERIAERLEKTLR